MSARAQMVHRCAIERDAAHGTPDGYGLPSEPNWQPLLENVPCFLWSTAGRELIGAEKSEVIEDLRMLVPMGTDVTARDRVNGVTDRLGHSIRQGAMGITGPPMWKHDHLELVLTGVQ
jgi:hypothetical protein